MITVQETTVWDQPYDNHKYILSDDKQWMYAFVRTGQRLPTLFKRPIQFSTKGRTFKLLVKTRDVAV